MMSWWPSFSFLRCWNSSNPRHFFPSPVWRNSMWRDRHGRLIHVGDLGLLWLWWEIWIGLEHVEYSQRWNEDLQAKAWDHLQEQEPAS